jgi:hypothetical protein
VKLADCLNGAAAEAMSLPVLHDDADVDAIAGHTGQPMRATVPRGSLGRRLARETVAHRVPIASGLPYGAPA